MMDKSREFTDRGEPTQRQQKPNRSNKRLPAAGPKKICRYGQNMGLNRGVGVSKEQNNLGIGSTLK